MLPTLQVTYLKEDRRYTQVIRYSNSNPLWRDIEAYVQFHLGATLIAFKKVGYETN